MRQNNQGLINPKLIQISKALQIKDLKQKLAKCASNINNTSASAKDKDSSKDKNFSYMNVKLYLLNFGLKDNKKETFEMIYAYKNKFKNFSLIAEEIIDDDNFIEVSI